MKILKFKKTGALLAATGLIALAGPAHAAPPYNITVGANTTGTYAFGAFTKTPITFNVTGPGGVVAMSCAMSTASGVIKAGASSTGLAVGELQGTAWSNCIGPGGLAMNVSHPLNSKWNLNLTGVATNPQTDNIAGNISNINAVVTSKIAGACNFTVTGRANATFREPAITPSKIFKQELAVNETAGNLTVSGVSGCTGAIVNGNTASFVGTYEVVTPTGYINVKP